MLLWWSFPVLELSKVEKFYNAYQIPSPKVLNLSNAAVRPIFRLFRSSKSFTRMCVHLVSKYVTVVVLCIFCWPCSYVLKNCESAQNLASSKLLSRWSFILWIFFMFTIHMFQLYIWVVLSHSGQTHFDGSIWCVKRYDLFF